ncbi:MAG: sigma-54-dependent Fis family transcriptional regulator [Chloroflexaceae bacterium]|nr:sigma-54-dependent Fis family transcriptional regulator [Chloroflexaceae bacterium]NJO05170.1 sigma-54-dependent Fis family transcriptional regulator [Chloroflexaceae bacterium]
MATADIFIDSTILVADDEPALLDLFEDMLGETGARVILARSGSEAIEIINKQALDLAILDVRMPEPGGLALLKHLREKNIDIPVLIVTGFSSSSIAIESTHRGAFDYLTKPFDLDIVLPTIERALEHRRKAQNAQSAPARPTTPDPRDTIIGQSTVMQQVYKMIGRVADSDATVLITGESGTGKELVAHTIHSTSPRRDMPFVAVNCAALTETLLETELFGHEKGAFTGATARRKGRFEQAHTGTIFLDEIGEISPVMQKKLLRVLQEKSFERVGGNVTITVDVRVLAATNRNLWQEVLAGRFREDLYYRLHVINLHMPPLRERKEDIPLLAEHFLNRFQQRHHTPPIRLTQEARDALMNHSWTGNVRQLENTIERAVVLSQDGLVTPEHLLLDQQAGPAMLDVAVADLLRQNYTLDKLLSFTQQAAFRIALQQHDGNYELAARALGVDVATLKAGV